MKRRGLITIAVVVAVAAAACSSSSGGGGTGSKPTTTKPPSKTVVLMTYDSFAVSKSVLAAFTAATGFKVKVFAPVTPGSSSARRSR